MEENGGIEISCPHKQPRQLLQGCCLNNAWTTLLLCVSSIVRKMLKTLGDARGLGLGLGSGIDIVHDISHRSSPRP